MKNIIEAHLIGLLALFITTFITSYLRAKSERPSVRSATALVHILLFVTITQLANEDTLDYLPYKLNRIVIALASGTLLSCLGCYLIWPHTASTKLRLNIVKSFGVLGSQVDILSEIVSVQSTPRNTLLLQKSHQDAFNKLKDQSDSIITSIQAMNSQSFFEFWTTLFMHRSAFLRIIICVERCFQFSSAVQHTASYLSILLEHEQLVSLCSNILYQMQ